MVHTGKHWLHTNNQMRGTTTLGELLRREGYATFATGKWHNGPESVLRSFERGAAVYMGGMSDHTEVFPAGHPRGSADQQTHRRRILE